MPNRNLTYRPILPTDRSWIVPSLRHIDVAKNTSQIPHPMTADFVTHWIKSWTDIAHKNQGLRIVGITDDQHGFGSAAFKKTAKNTAEISFWISPNFWRQGRATHIITEIIKAAKLAKVGELTAGHFIDNLGSQRLLQNFGFEREPRTIRVHSQSRNCDVETVRYHYEF